MPGCWSVRPAHPTPYVLWEGSEDTLPKIEEISLVRGALAILQNSVVTLLCRWEMRGRLGHQNGLPEFSENDGILGHQRSSGGTLLAEKVIVCVIMNSKAKGIIRMLWFTEIFAFAHCAVLEAEIDGKPINILLDFNKWKTPRSGEHKSDKSMWELLPLSEFHNISQFLFPEHLECGAGQFLLKKDPDIPPP